MGYETRPGSDNSWADRALDRAFQGKCAILHRCGDNESMIAFASEEAFRAWFTSELSVGVSPSVLMGLHAAIEQALAHQIGGTPRSGARPIIVIVGREYEALPDFLLDPVALRERSGFWADVDTETTEEVQEQLPLLAGLVMTREAVQRLLEDCLSITDRRRALEDLAAIVQRMIDKGVV